jgi:hypothetical protein
MMIKNTPVVLIRSSQNQIPDGHFTVSRLGSFSISARPRERHSRSKGEEPVSFRLVERVNVHIDTATFENDELFESGAGTNAILFCNQRGASLSIGRACELDMLATSVREGI